MSEVRVLQLRWYVWAAIGAGSLLLIDRRFPWLLSGHSGVLTVSLLIVVLYVMHRLWQAPPAIMMCAGLVLTIFSGSWGSVGLPGFPFLPDRLLIFGAIAALILCSPGARHRPSIKVRPVHLLLVLLTFYALGSAAAGGTIGTESGVFDLLDRLGIVPFTMLALAPVIFHGPRERQMLLTTLVGLGAYLSLTAIFESLGPHALVFPHYIVASDASLPGERAGGPFRSADAEGFATFSCGVAALIAFSQWQGMRRRYLAGAVMVLCTLACFVTLERAVWIAAAAGAVGVALAAGGARRLLVPGALAAGVLVGGALLLSPALASKASARVSDQRSVWDRENQTAAALRMIEAKPLFGFGWDRYVDESLPYFRQGASYPMTGYPTAQDELPLHDSYLSYAVELGLVGALMWLAALFWGLGGAIFSPGAASLRPWKLGLLAMTIFFLVITAFDPLQQNFTQLLLWTWAGVAIGAGAPSGRRLWPLSPLVREIFDTGVRVPGVLET